MGMGVGMNAGGGFMGAASAANMQQMQMNQGMNQAAPFQPGMDRQPGTAQPSGMPSSPAQPSGWTCGCGTVNTGKFCSECGSPRPAAEWTCSCGSINKGKFCSECGKPRP